jgi:hypothetical protein
MRRNGENVRGKQKLIILLVFLMGAIVLPKMDVFAGEQSTAVTAYDMPAGMPSGYVSSDFGVAVNGVDVDIYYSGNNAWGKGISFAAFDFTGSVTVTVTTNFSFSSARILPRSSGIACAVSGNSVTFELEEPQNVTILFDENFQGKTLHLFAQAPETEIPDANDSNVIYFAPGYYDYSNQAPLMIPSGKTLYLAGGAVVRGRVLVSGAANVTIRGKGILLNDFTTNDGYDSVALAIKSSNYVTIKDIIISRNAGSWSAFMWKCGNITVEDTKIINPRYASSDGFDIANSHDVLFDGMFIRSCDDSIAIKGTGTSGYVSTENPANALPNYNITIQNLQVWSDANNALGIGAETVAAYYDAITLKNIDILYNYDDYNYPDYFKERAAINICALNATPMSNITFEDIRVEQGKRLIGIDMSEDFWFGSLQGNWSWEGNMSNITFKNITSYSSGSNEIRIYGKDSAHNISSVTFKDIVINGQTLSDFNDSHFEVNSFVNNLKIINGGNQAVTADGPFGNNVHRAAEEFSTTQGGNGWYYRTWTAGAGNFDMSWNPDQSGHWRGPNSYDAIWVYGNNLYLHPDNDQTMLEWKAPRSGEINIVGTVKKYDIGGGDGVVVSIWKNGTIIWPSNWLNIAYNDNTGADHNFMTTVSTGDVISFRVDEGANNAYDTTMWNTTIVYE